jgi:hypothetical protein
VTASTRRVASVVLAVAGCVLVLAGGFALYAREEVFNAAGFAENSSEALKDDQVKQALGQRITDQAIDRGPDPLINATPVVEAVVEGVIESTPFRAAYRKAARKLYRALFERDRDEVALSVGSADVLIADGVTALSPKIGKRIPRDLGDRVVQVTDSGIVLTAVRISKDVRFLAYVLPLLGLACLVGSVVASPDRRRGLLRVAGGIAIAAVVGFVLLLVGRSILLSHFDDETVRGAVEAVWESFLGGFEDILIYAGFVAILVAAAAAMAREWDPVAPVRDLYERVTRTPETTGRRAGRAVAIAAIGLLCVLDPDLVVRIVVVVAGAYAVFFAACELLALIGEPVGEAARRRTRQSLRQTLVSPRVIAGTVAVGIVLIAGTIALASGGDEGERQVTRPPGPVTHCNGFEELCEKTLDQVSFPAAHNAMSAASLPGWYQPNQRHDIRRQLDDGVRAFLIDSHYGIKRSSGPVLTDLEREGTSKVLETVRSQLGADAALAFQSIQAQYARRGGQGESGSYFCHIVCELGSTSMTQVLGWFKDFLDTHPDEVLVLFIEDKVSPADTAEAFEKSGILHYAHVQKPGKPFPTMRELIESDKRLFVMAEVDSGRGAIPWYHPGFQLAMETPYTFDSPEALADAESCIPNRGGEGRPLFQLNHWVERLPRSPDTASQVNSFDFLLERAKRCQRERQALPGLVAVDYYNEGDVVEVTKALNGIPRETEPDYRERD